MKHKFVEVYVFLQLIGTILFIYGYFPPRIVLQNDMTKWHNNSLGNGRKADRLVLMIIDAFAYDFVSHPNYLNDMPFLHERLKTDHSLMFRAHVQSPTVTLPRLKALVSGTIPNFMDIAFNFAKAEYNEDNWITRAYNKGYKILFYGDDTWLGMFNKKNFVERSEGTSSFFATDYTEVDTNVTRHLKREFLTNFSHTWDVMILHYLGLDHIGHSLGGKSPKINVKLREMDNVVNNILNDFAKSKRDDENIWFLLLGDHGSTIAGNHGGNSERETHVPVFVWSSMELKQKSFDVVNIEQIDLAPTISMLLDLNIPEKNIGISLDEHFSTDLKTISTNMQMNARQFYLLALENKVLFNENEIDELNRCKNFEESKLSEKEFISKCRLILKSTQRKFLMSTNDVNYTYMILGTVISLMATAALIFTSLNDQSIGEGLLVLIQPFTLFSSSFIEEEHDIWYYLFSSYVFIVSAKNCWNQKTKNIDHSKLYDLLILLTAHRLSRFPYEIYRRRYTINDEFGVFNINMNNQSFEEGTIYLWLIAVMLLILREFPFKLLCSNKPFNNFYVLFSAIFVLATKFSFIPSTLICYLLILGVFLISGWSHGFIVWQLLVLNPMNYPIALLCQLIGYKLGKLNHSSHFNHSMLLYAALSSSFFYTGAGNTFDKIDIASGYSGLSDHIFLIVGLQISLNAYSGLVNLMIGWNFASKTTDLPISQLIIDVLALRSLALFFTIVNMFHNGNHIFNWSVFTPKLLIEAIHFLNAITWAVFQYFVSLFRTLIASKSFNKLL